MGDGIAIFGSARSGEMRSAASIDPPDGICSANHAKDPSEPRVLHEIFGWIMSERLGGKGELSGTLGSERGTSLAGTEKVQVLG